MGMYVTLYAIYVLFDYTYNLILRTGESPISSDDQLSTVSLLTRNIQQPKQDLVMIACFDRL